MNVLILIKRQSLQLFYSDRKLPVECVVPETAMKDLEITNEKELDLVLTKYLLPVPAKMVTQTILLLDNDICFSAKLEQGREEEIKKAQLESSPFLHVVSTTFSVEGNAIFITTNQDLIQSIGRVLESHRYAILAVCPWHVVQYAKVVAPGETFNAASMKRLFDSADSIKQLGFPYQNEVLVAIPQELLTKKVPNKKISKGWIIFLSVAGVWVVVMIIWLLIRR